MSMGVKHTCGASPDWVVTVTVVWGFTPLSAIILLVCLTPTGHLAAVQCPTPVFSPCSPAPLPLPPPLSSLCWLAPVQCRPVRASREETGVPHEPKTILRSTGWAPVGGSISNPGSTLGRPQPVVRHLPRVPALISWCVCTPGWHWHQPANIAHGPSNNFAFTNFTNRGVKLVFILANDDD